MSPSPPPFHAEPPNAEPYPEPACRAGKRGKSCRPQPQELVVNASYDWRYPTPEISDYDSNSDVDSDDNDWESEDSCDDDAELALGGHPKFQALREDLVQSSYRSLKPWMKATRYAAPPDYQRPPRKRRNIETPDHQRQPGQSGHYHAACPFYLSDPKKYHNCVMDHDLLTALDVRRHVQRHHMKPLYCPMCYQEFTTVLGRDVHISARSCPMHERREKDGIDGYQRAMLSKRDEPGLDERARLRHVWETVFPDSEAPRSLFLDEGCGLALSSTRDYWRQHGRKCVSRYLHDHGQEGGEKEQVALVKLTLKALLRKVTENISSV